MSNVLHITKRLEKLEKVREYLEMPRGGRMPLPVFRKEFGIRRNEFLELKHSIETEERERQRQIARNVSENLLSGLGDREEVGIKEFFGSPENKLKWLRGTLEAAEKGNAQSQKLIAQILEVVVEKSEVKVGLSAEDYAHIREDGRRRAEDTHREFNGDRGLLSKPALLSEEVRQG